MTNEEAIKIFTESEKCFCKHGAYKDCNSRCKYREALNMAIKALEQTSHLIARPCEMCEFYTEDGCSKWECVFEEDKE